MSGQTDSALQIYKNNELTHDSFVKRPLDDLDLMVVNSLIDQSYFIGFMTMNLILSTASIKRSKNIYIHEDGKSQFINTNESWLFSITQI